MRPTFGLDAPLGNPGSATVHFMSEEICISVDFQ